MAFPDYGPLKDISQFTQDGFAQGSFFFKLFAGEISNTLALHYLGLTFALVGAILIVFNKNFHNVKTIVSWSFIVLVLLIGPRKSSAFFTNIETNTSAGIQKTVEAYTPQAVVVDIMSKIHRAIYVGFFDISEPGQPRMRNAVEDWTRTATASNTSNTQLDERPDIQQEIQAYVTLECGPSANLAYDLYNHTRESAIGTLRSMEELAPLPISTYQLTAQESYELQQKVFKVRDINKLLSVYATAYANKTTFAPFGVIYTERENMMKSLEASGVSEDAIALYGKSFELADADELEDKVVDLSYAITTRENLMRSWNSSGPYLNHNTATTDIDSPTILGIINNVEALENHGWTGTFNDFIDDKSPSPWTHSANSYLGLMDGTDPIEQRLRKVRSTVFLEQQAERDAWNSYVQIPGSSKDRLNIPMSIGFLTPPIVEIYKNRAHQSVGGLAKRDMSNFTKYPHVNVLNTCAQLHEMTRRHIQDAVIFQNAWPNHDEMVTLTGGNQDIGETISMKPGALAKVGGFKHFVAGADKSYLAYPYNADMYSNTNIAMDNLYYLVQNIAKSFTYQDTDTGEEFDALNTNAGNLNTKEQFAEMLRLATLKSTMDTALKNTNIPFVKLSSTANLTKLATEKATSGTTELDTSMQASFSGDMIQKNLPNVGSGVLAWATKYVAEIGTQITAQFAGVGAVAFVRFIQLFISIALFFILMCTPILYMMGLVIPAHAPGVIVVSLISVLALKAIPIGYTLVDAVMSNAMRNYNGVLNLTDTDYALMLYVTATAYTSVTLITFFLLFKAGDSSAVLGQISSMDNKANEIADSAAKVVKGVALAAAGAVAVGGAGAIAAKSAGKTTGSSLKAGANQGLEIFGREGLGAIPGVGNVAQQVITAPREGRAEAGIRDEVKNASSEIDTTNAKLNAELNSSGISDERRAEITAEIARNSEMKSNYSTLVNAQKDAVAENKYRSVTSGGADHLAAGRAEGKAAAIAKDRGTSMQELRRENREASANADAYRTVGDGAKNMDLKDAKVQMTGSDIHIDAEAARAIQMGQLQAARTYKQASPRAAQSSAENDLQNETRTETLNRLNNEVVGPARKIARSPVTTQITTEDGVVQSKTIPQDEMFDQAATKLKSQVAELEGVVGSSPLTLKVETESVSSQHLSAHQKGVHSDGEAFKLAISEPVKEILKNNGLEDVLTSKDAGKLWLDPERPEHANAYKQISALKDPSLNVPAGHSISLFNMHLARSEKAKEQVIKQIKQKNKELEKIKGLS
tara:strand:- start:185430 stop:189227 length:3798 start_codon:yes stop_codon:yes gene_type:complete